MGLNQMDGEQLKDSPTERQAIMKKARIRKNLIVLCLGFLFHFTAYQSLVTLQSTLNVEDDVGVVSQSVIYATFIVSSIFLPKLAIKKLGCKLTISLSILTYVPYIVANFYPQMVTLLISSIILGLGAAPLWVAEGTYINEISAMYSTYGSDTADIVTSKFFGIFNMVYQNTQIWGNLVSFIVLKPLQYTGQRNSSPEEGISTDFHNQGVWEDLKQSANATCGIKFSNQLNENLKPPPKNKRYLLVGIYLGCVILASGIVAIFLDRLQRKDAKDSESVLSRTVATLKQLRKSQQLFLIPLTVFNGIQQAFILADYTRAYVSCTWGLYSVGLVFICYGAVNAVMSLLAGYIVKYVPRKFLMMVGATGNIGVCIALHLWKPEETEFIYAFIIVGVWGLSDAIWNTQIIALYGILFRSEEEAAFANCRLWESLGYSLAFAYSSFLNLPQKMYILLTFLLSGMTGYMTVEVRTSKKDSDVVSEPNIAIQLHV